jgi:hypothetical protein
MSVNLYDNVIFTVEIGFATTGGNNKVPLGGLLTDIVWTDVTDYVREVSTQRGRNNELDEFSTGTCQITLSNGDRRFDPEYSAGPYFGELTPGRPVRIRGRYAAGSTLDLFFGFIDDWQQDYDYSFDSTATVSASDAFKVLNQLTLDSYFNYDTLQANPTFWIKLDEQAGTNLALDSSKNGFNFRWVDLAGNPSVSQSASPLLPDSNENVGKFDGTNGLILETQSNSIGAGSPTNADQTVELVFSTDTLANGDYGIFRIGGAERMMAVGLNVTDGVGTVRVLKGSIGGFFTMGLWTSTVIVNDGLPHHVILPLRGTSYPEQRLPTVDGVAMTNDPGPTIIDLDLQANPPRRRPTSDIALPLTGLSASNFSSPFTGSIGPIVFHPITFTNAQIQERYQIVSGQYLAGQTSSDRVGTILDMASWMSDARDIGTGNSTVQAIRTNGKTVLAALKECEAAEQGRLFIDPSGEVKFIPRQAINTTTIYNTSQRTYGDAGSELPYTNIEFAFNDRLIANRVTVSKENGSSFTANDTASQGEYFIRAQTLSDLIVESERFPGDLATAQVATYKQPELRVESLQVNPRSKPASLYPAILLDDVGVRVTVIRRPQSIGSAITKSLILEGVGHSITTDNWVTTYSFSPVPPDYFVLDSATFGVLDQNLLGY